MTPTRCLADSYTNNKEKIGSINSLMAQNKLINLFFKRILGLPFWEDNPEIFTKIAINMNLDYILHLKLGFSGIST